MLTYPNIDPVAFHIGPLPVHWYGLMYLFGILAAWGLLALRSREVWRGFNAEQVSDVVFYAALGVILGGRVGFMLFYDFHTVITAPWRILMVWNGGMSFHGGLLGVALAMWLYARKTGKAMGDLTDFVAPVIPIGLGLGRIGNFINAELWGKVTDVPWGIVFPGAGDLPRHPSQLYEFILEGFVLFLILWIYSRHPRPRWAVSALFLIFYGIFRFIVEFFRLPDANIGYLAFGWLTEGQLLSLPMIVIGIVLLVWSYRRK